MAKSSFKLVDEPATNPELLQIADDLEKAAIQRIGAMDSESRAREVFGNLQRACIEAAAKLRAL